jgi:phosphatidylglycerol:prolipoprotein diacylglycerol transferase
MPGDPMHLHPIALYAALIALLIAAISFRLLHRPLPAGSTAGWTLSYIGLAQYALTFLRQPGATALNGLELLQWAALAMLIVGAALVFFLKTRTQPASA